MANILSPHLPAGRKPYRNFMKTKCSLLLALLFFHVNLFATVVITNGLTHRHAISGAVDKIEGKVIVRNDGLKESRVTIYKQDIIPDCTTGLNYTDISNHERSLGKWITTNVDEKLLSPQEEYSFYYTIEVPKGTDLTGTYWSILMVEVADPIKEEQENGFTVESKVRYGVQVIADMGTYQSPKLTFENIEFTKDETNEKVIRVKLRNNGIFFSATKLNIELIDKNGNKTRTSIAEKRKLYPGYCNDFEVTIRDLPKGVFEGILIADNGVDLFGSNVTIENK